MVLANRVDSLNFRYYPDKVYYTTGLCDITNVVDAAGNAVSEVTQKSEAKYVVISVLRNPSGSGHSWFRWLPTTFTRAVRFRRGAAQLRSC